MINRKLKTEVRKYLNGDTNISRDTVGKMLDLIIALENGWIAYSGCQVNCSLGKGGVCSCGWRDTHEAINTDINNKGSG